jgi:hypothetical protein
MSTTGHVTRTSVKLFYGDISTMEKLQKEVNDFIRMLEKKMWKEFVSVTFHTTVYDGHPWFIYNVTYLDQLKIKHK